VCLGWQEIRALSSVLPQQNKFSKVSKLFCCCLEGNVVKSLAVKPGQLQNKVVLNISTSNNTP